MGLDLTGIIAGALGGGAQAVQSMAQSQIEAQQKADLFDHQQEAELMKAQRLHDYQVQSANDQRVARNARIDSAQSGIVNGIMSKRYAGSDADVAAAAGGASPDVSAAPGNDDVQAALTPEQADVIAQAKASDAANLNANPQVRLQALRGEMTPDEEAKTNATLQRADLTNERARYVADTGASAKRDVASTIAGGRTDAAQIAADARIQATQMRNDARATMANPDVSLDRREDMARKIIAHADTVQSDPFATPEMKAQVKADADEARQKMKELEGQRGSRAAPGPASGATPPTSFGAPTVSAPAPAAALTPPASAAADFMKRFAPGT